MNDDHRLLAERLADAARDLQGQDDPQATVESAVQLAAVNVDGCDAAAISLIRNRRKIETAAMTDPRALQSDRLQYELKEGPCLDAVWDHPVVHGPRLATDGRWPTWAPRAADELGIGSMLCFRLFTHGDTVGALNLYSWSSDAFDDRDQHDGLALAAHVAIAVADAQKIDQLSTALSSRTVIGQAVGIVMERYGLSSDAAFNVLRRLSSASNTKIREMAEQVVATRRLPDRSAEDRTA